MRTQQQIDDAVKNGDYTGGYSWWPWLFFMRTTMLISILGSLTGGAYIITKCQDGNAGPTISIVVGSFFILIFVGAIYKLRSEYNNLKKGISS